MTVISGPAVLSALLAALAVAMWVRPSPLKHLDHLAPGPTARRRLRGRLLGLLVGALSVSLAAGVLLGAATGTLVATGAVVASVVVDITWNRHDDAIRRRRRIMVSQAARALSGQLRTGQVPTQALRTASVDYPALHRPAATLAIGGDVSTALRHEGTVPGQEGLLTLAMAWELSERSGAPVAGLVQRVAETLRGLDDARAQVAAELAGPRATGRLLACLPLVGVGLGFVAGGNPTHFLLSTWPGRLCLLGGVVLAGAGALWSELLADRAQR